MRSWYNNLESYSIGGFSDLYAKIVMYFSTRIPAKKSFTKLFSITQLEGHSTRAYLNRFNKEIHKVKELIETMASKALISEVRERALWRKLYVLPDKSLFKVKQVMKNYIRVEKARVLLHESFFFFYSDSQYEEPLKRNHYPDGNEISRKNQEGLVHERLVYPKGLLHP